MIDGLGPGTTLGYCTNVHAGPTLDATIANLRHHAVAVKQMVSPDQPMGIGLWLAEDAARSLRADGVSVLAEWLDQVGLDVFTFNGFPQGDFHQPVVKHRVYSPDWSSPSRLAYTVDLIHVLAELRSVRTGSISTLPIGWRAVMSDDRERQRTAAANLRTAVQMMADIEERTGTLVHLDLEPEPGCLFDRAEDVVAFFEQYLLGHEDDERVRRYLRVCHDICHSEVMFEPIGDVISAYRSAGIQIGKVQISSAVRVDFEAMSAVGRKAALAQLSAFREERYLHQTMVRARDGSFAFFEDLGAAIDGMDDPQGEWRVHFHVPIFVDRFGELGTTQATIAESIVSCQAAGVAHFEVETYAWDVLPAGLRAHDLASGIAQELAWVRGVLERS